MLELIRKGAIDNPWLFRVIMGIIAVTFVLTMGWWGLSAPTSNAVAKVNDHEISRDEYQRSVQSATNFYRNLFKENFN